MKRTIPSVVVLWHVCYPHSHGLLLYFTLFGGRGSYSPRGLFPHTLNTGEATKPNFNVASLRICCEGVMECRTTLSGGGVCVSKHDRPLDTNAIQGTDQTDPMTPFDPCLGRLPWKPPLGSFLRRTNHHRCCLLSPISSLLATSS